MANFEEGCQTQNKGKWEPKFAGRHFWFIYLDVGEGDAGIDEMEERDLNLDGEAGRQLHVDEVLQLLNTYKRRPLFTVRTCTTALRNCWRDQF